MRSQHDRTFRPRLEAFEDRNLPSMLSNFFSSLFGSGSPPAPPPSENLTAGQPLNLTGTAAAMTLEDGLSHPGVTPPSQPRSTSGGSSVIVTTNNSSSQAGGATSSSSAVAAVTNTLALNPDGSVSGSFFGTSPSQAATTPAAADPAGAVPTIVSTAGGPAQSFSPVPNPTNFGLTDPVPPVAAGGAADPGLSTPGLITPATIRNDPGINIPV